jgi:hypothetical protein
VCVSRAAGLLGVPYCCLVCGYPTRARPTWSKEHWYFLCHRCVLGGLSS